MPPRHVRLAVASVALLALSSPARAGRVPIGVNVCDLEALGSSVSQGVAWSAEHGLAVIDTGPDLVLLLDRDCRSQGNLDVGRLGINSPTGITWHGRAGLYAITDSADDQLSFVDRAGALAGTCDLAALGLTSPQGVAWDADRDLLVVIDADTRAAVFVDDAVRQGGPCATHGAVDLAAIGVTTPEGVSAFTPGVIAVYDAGTVEVSLVDAGGHLLERFDLQGTTGAYTTDVTWAPGLDRWFVSSTNDTLTEVDARGTAAEACPTDVVGVLDVSDVAYRALTDEVLLVDPVADVLVGLDAATCAETRRMDLAALGLTEASALAIDEERNQYLVADRGTDTLLFVDDVTGRVAQRCDLRELGIRMVSGVEVVPLLGHVLLLDQDRDKIVVTDASCATLHVRSADLDARNGAVSPTSLTFNRGLGELLIVDDTMDRLYVADVEGRVVDEVDTAGLGLLDPTGLAAAPGAPGRFYVSDAGADAVVVLDLPRLGEGRGISGYWEAGVASLYLFDRGEGRFTGEVFLRNARIPVFGMHDPATGRVAFGAWPGANPMVLSGSLAPGFDRLVLPAPAATMTRAF